MILIVKGPMDVAVVSKNAGNNIVEGYQTNDVIVFNMKRLGDKDVRIEYEDAKNIRRYPEEKRGISKAIRETITETDKGDFYLTFRLFADDGTPIEYEDAFTGFFVNYRIEKHEQVPVSAVQVHYSPTKFLSMQFSYKIAITAVRTNGVLTIYEGDIVVRSKRVTILA